MTSPITSDRLTFAEHIDVKECTYMTTLTLEQFKTSYCTGDWKELNGEQLAIDVRTYQRQVKTFCLDMVKRNGTNKTVYKYGKNRSSGRIYTEQFGIQRLSKPLRDLLVPATLVDYDMVNCHPTLLLYLARLNDLPALYLAEYVDNRAETLLKSNNDKTTILIIMNKDANRPRNADPWTTSFINELKILKAALYAKHSDQYPATNTRNPISSCVNKLMCDLENKLLQQAMQKYVQDGDDCVPMFDGFMCSRAIAVDELNTMTTEYGVTWKVKGWEKGLLPKDYDADKNAEYEKTKQRFEEGRFLIESPLMYNIDGLFVSKEDFKERARKYTYKVGEKKVGIYDAWIADETQRSYESITCQPYNPLEGDTTPEQVYNEATPFAFRYIEDASTRDTRPLDDLRYLLSHLSTNDIEAEYVLKYIADILQNPRSNPQVIVIFKGHLEGVGKDTINKTINKLLGSEYVASVGDMNMVFGTYNPIVDKKLVIQFNECKSSQGHSSRDLLWDMATADSNTIHQKYIVDKQQPNYCRLFASSNNPSPLPVGRRTCVCQTRCDVIISPEWFTEYYGDKLTNNHYMDSLGSALLDMDLSEFTVKKPPRSEVHAAKAGGMVKPIHVFLQRMCEGEYSSHNEVFDISEGIIGCKKAWLLQTYRSFHECNYAIATKEEYKRDVDTWACEYITSIKIEGRAYVNGKQIRCVTFDTGKLLASLKNGQRYTEAEVDDE
jgi:hypothetical protein